MLLSRISCRCSGSYRPKSKTLISAFQSQHPSAVNNTGATQASRTHDSATFSIPSNQRSKPCQSKKSILELSERSPDLNQTSAEPNITDIDCSVVDIEPTDNGVADTDTACVSKRDTVGDMSQSHTLSDIQSEVVYADSSSLALVPYQPLLNYNTNANIDGMIIRFIIFHGWRDACTCQFIPNRVVLVASTIKSLMVGRHH